MESVALPSSHLLEENLTIAAVPALFETFKSAKDSALILNAEHVKHLDWPVLQLFLSFAKDRRVKGQQFSIENISENFQFGLDTLGIELDAITSGGAA